MLLVAVCTACGGEPTTRLAIVDAGPPQAGVIRGTATTSDGRPIRTFGGDISGYTAQSGEVVNANIDGKDGKYDTDVGVGQFSSRAWTDVDYHGGTIELNPEGHGVQYWWNIQRDSKHAPEPKIAADATVELTLTPDGPLIDGSEGKPVVLKIRGADIKGPMDRKRHGIPIGRYKATATATLADGTQRPLRVRSIPAKGGEESPPSTNAVLEFAQSRPPSDIVNRADELTVHLMY